MTAGGWAKVFKNAKPLSELEKTFRIDMRAEISTLDTTVLDKLKNKFDGRTKVIGC